jgi:methylated-DNA-protein-cysteine methyltransferase-like protein
MPGDKPFERVWKILGKLPRGRVTTYGQLSQLIGGRLTPIGIGWAIRAAPEGTIPWHRVVGAKGRIATHREHPGLQREMLESEGVRFTADGHVDMTRHAWSRSPKTTSKTKTNSKKTKTKRVSPGR